jgi:dolichol-phosphate mannosyltransferase
LAAGDPRVRYRSLSRNFGHQAALTAGLELAQGDVVISLDSDLQHPPSLIPALLDQWQQGYDIVLTLRNDDPRLGRFKRLTSRVFYKILRSLSDIEVRAAAADFRLMSRKAAQALLQMPESHRFVRGMVSWLGFATTTVSFAPADRGAGVSKYTLRKMMRLAGDGLVSFTRVPLRLATILGLCWLAIGAMAIVAAIILAFASSLGVVLTTLAIAVVGLACGCVLVCLGIAGEYFGRIYEEVKRRPLYLIKESSDDADSRRRSLSRAA